MFRVVPLGGLGEIGLNAMVAQTADDAVLIDCGLLFPGPQTPGVGFIVPDFEYLRELGGRLRAVVLTHAHEDHIGALPYLLRDRSVPVYATPFTMALARHRCDELGISVDLREMAPRERFRLGRLEVEPLQVTHSVPDAVGLALHAGGRTLIHTGDFKLDPTPPDGRATDETRLAELGEAGVACLLSDSTNAENPSSAGSERDVAAAMERLILPATGRVAVAMFSSHVLRLGLLLNLFAKAGRAVVLQGRSLLRNVELAQRTGHLAVPPGLLVSADEATRLPQERVGIVTTGAQAEPRSGLFQMAFDPAAPLKARAGDLFILSARVIPGNERAISELVNRLIADGVTVVRSNIEPVHVSGHAGQPELRALLSRVRPRSFIPIHGEVRHLVSHLRLAREAGVPDAGRVLARDGQVITVDDDGARISGEAPAGRIHHDLWGNGTLSEEALSERVKLLEAGILAATVVIDSSRRALAASPRLAGRGLSSEEQAMLPELAAVARTALESLSPELLGDDVRVEEVLVQAIRRAVKERTGKRPGVLPVILKL